MKIVITTPVHNRREITLECLRSLERINRTDFEIHTIIVDDGSTDGTSEAIQKEFPKVELIKGDGNLWYTGGINRGLEAALKHNPDYILTINDDSTFDEEFLQRLISCAEENPRSVVGALLVLNGEGRKVFQVAPEWNTWYGGWRHWYHQTVDTMPKEPFEVGIICGNCVLYPVEAIKEVGLMDEKKFIHFGDAEYTPRMRRAGWRLLIEPRSQVFCHANNPSPTLSKMSFKQLYRLLWQDTKQFHNLRLRYRGNIAGAPNYFQAVLATIAFVVRVGLKAIGLSPNWPVSKTEEPLDKMIREGKVNLTK
jgi:GT2 family glycosyltransferase